MAAALPLKTRRAIIEGHRAGQSLRSLASAFAVNFRTVQTLCRRNDTEGEAGLLPHYQNCGPTGPRSQPLLRRAACWLKRLHRSWGAPLIRVHLAARYPTMQIPAARTMQRWFKAAGLYAPRSTVPKSPKQWAHQVHQVWQVDAKEQQRTADATACCWLTMTDEHSAAILATPVFPLWDDQPGATAAGTISPH